jgi:transcriptional regulator with XRE-family HTH domain
MNARVAIARGMTNPTPEAIRVRRDAAGLTQAQAAELVGSSARTWQDWEAGIARMHTGLWELFQLKLAERSLGSRFETWVRLAAELEDAGVSADQLKRILSGDQSTLDRVLIKLGLASQADMRLIPADVVRRTKIKFPSDKTLDAR